MLALFHNEVESIGMFRKLKKGCDLREIYAKIIYIWMVRDATSGDSRALRSGG
jgi:hypothetical protein